MLIQNKRNFENQRKDFCSIVDQMRYFVVTPDRSQTAKSAN